KYITFVKLSKRRAPAAQFVPFGGRLPSPHRMSRGTSASLPVAAPGRPDTCAAGENMSPTAPDAVLRLLQDDLAGEHAAIIQYLQHVWRMGDAGGDIPCEVQEIAR